MGTVNAEGIDKSKQSRKKLQQQQQRLYCDVELRSRAFSRVVLFFLIEKSVIK